MKKKLLRNNSGFTLIELLVVIGIISTLLTIGVGALVSYYHIQTFNVGVADVVTTLQTAKSYAQSQVKKQCTTDVFYGYRVSIINTSTFRLIEVCEGDIQKKVEDKTMHTDLTITPSISVTFRALSGNVEPSGTSSFTISGYNRSQIIKINTAGSISVCPANAPSC